VCRSDKMIEYCESAEVEEVLSHEKFPAGARVWVYTQ